MKTIKMLVTLLALSCVPFFTAVADSGKDGEIRVEGLITEISSDTITVANTLFVLTPNTEYEDGK